MYNKCMICPRQCGVDRTTGMVGFCNENSNMRISRAALHFWEEPSVSGEKGSGAVFFAGCSLKCVYCQNHEISRGNAGWEISEKELVRIFFDLKALGAVNINLVTPTHFTDSIVRAIELSKAEGFDLPFVYNTSSYELVENIRKYDGLIDVYLPDYKYVSAELGARYSGASDYPKKAIAAIEEMLKQVGKPVFENGLIKRGVIVRHLCLPGHVKESKAVVKQLYDQFGDDIYISIMSQFTPVDGLLEDYPELNRKLTKREYSRVVDYAIELGIENAYIQEGDVALESFIPEFKIMQEIP